MVEYAVQQNPDTKGMGFLHQRADILFASHMWVYLVVIEGVIPVVRFCRKNRVQINAVEPHGRDIIQILRNAPDGAAQTGFPIGAAGKRPESVGEAVRENVVDNGVLRPFRDGKPVSAMVEGKLEIIRPGGRSGHFVAIAKIAERLRPVRQFKPVRNTLKLCFQTNLVPVKIPVFPDFFHGQAGKIQLRRHGGAVGVKEAAAPRLAFSGSQAENIVGTVRGKREFAQWSMVNCCGIHTLSFHRAADDAGNVVFLHSNKE